MLQGRLSPGVWVLPRRAMKLLRGMVFGSDTVDGRTVLVYEEILDA